MKLLSKNLSTEILCSWYQTIVVCVVVAIKRRVFFSACGP